MRESYHRVVQALADSVERNLAQGLLLSGGLDTSLLAYLAVKWIKPDCFTVALNGAPAPDIEYAKLVADSLGLEHDIHGFGEAELDEAVRNTIEVVRCFDPMEIRNSVAIYVGLKRARDKGMRSVMTGDGCDELLAGYSFFFGLDKGQLDSALKNLRANMRFSSIYLAEALGMEVKLPYLDPQFESFAAALDSDLKVRSERGQVWGKWILRKAFENIVPQEIVWRVKAPIEVGSGTATLPSRFDSTIPDLEFDEKRARYLNQDKVTIRDKEHLFYYEVYRSIVGVPHPTLASAKICPDCNSDVPNEASFCRTCGAYPV
jgi:asparagine synthase (glutamine-hydrolysing)